MKVCIIGAGAIGGLLGARLAEAGEDVSVVDVGAHLAAIRRNGLKLIMDDVSEHLAHPRVATADPAEAGPQDVVFLAVKTHVLPRVAPRMAPLLGPETRIVPVQNGLPWWYFQRLGGPHEGRHLEAVDPGGTLARAIDPQHILGCVVYPAGEIVEPGVVRHVEGNRFPLGELDGRVTERAQAVADMLGGAGFKSFVLEDIRSEIWLKLWGNLSFNPISALTHATLVDICEHRLTRDLAADMMAEAQQVAERLGASFRVSIDQRIEGAAKVGKHKTSMLQDVEAGRPLELDALLAAVVELARVTGVPTPHIDAVYALASLLDRTMSAEEAAVVLRRIA